MVVVVVVVVVVMVVVVVVVVTKMAETAAEARSAEAWVEALARVATASQRRRSQPLMEALQIDSGQCWFPAVLEPGSARVRQPRSRQPA